MIVIQMIVCGFAGWRSASMLSKEDGPFGIFDSIRQIVGVRPRSQIVGLAKLWICVWCTSVWTTAGFWGLWYVHPAIPGIVAAMGVAIVIEQWVRPQG